MLELLIAGVGAVVPLVGLIVWLVRLEGRINLHAAEFAAMEKRVDGLEEQILAQLERVNSRLDKLLDRTL